MRKAARSQTERLFAVHGYPGKAAPGGAERARHQQNSTKPGECQAPNSAARYTQRVAVDNLRTVKRAPRGPAGGCERGARSATHAAGAEPQAGGQAHPGAPSGGGRAGGGRGERSAPGSAAQPRTLAARPAGRKTPQTTNSQTQGPGGPGAKRRPARAAHGPPGRSCGGLRPEGGPGGGDPPPRRHARGGRGTDAGGNSTGAERPGGPGQRPSREPRAGAPEPNRGRRGAAQGPAAAGPPRRAATRAANAALYPAAAAAARGRGRPCAKSPADGEADAEGRTRGRAGGQIPIVRRARIARPGAGATGAPPERGAGPGAHPPYARSGSAGTIFRGCRSVVARSLRRFIGCRSAVGEAHPCMPWAPGPSVRLLDTRTLFRQAQRSR